MIQIKRKFICCNCYSIVDAEMMFDIKDEKKLLILENRNGIDYFCDKCKKATYHFSVDEGLEKIIQKLNINGYETTNSCGGHFNYIWENDDAKNPVIEITGSTPFISFAIGIQKDKRFKTLVKAIEDNTNFKLDAFNSPTGNNVYSIRDEVYNNMITEICSKVDSGKITLAECRAAKTKLAKLAEKDIKRLVSILHRELD